MGRMIRSVRTGTPKNLHRQFDMSKFTNIPNAEVYWGDDGILIVTASQEWVDYLCGRQRDIPADNGVDLPVETDQNIVEFLLSGVRI